MIFHALVTFGAVHPDGVGNIACPSVEIEFCNVLNQEIDFLILCHLTEFAAVVHDRIDIVGQIKL